ncbi:MAG: hypothetical protein C5B48_04055 [Candidatus Rokuibacteriota bacterium]|nr:MAG: hypothetical protein C5B48_04055 [Candidatus Rokubacteria bacterium]
MVSRVIDAGEPQLVCGRGGGKSVESTEARGQEDSQRAADVRTSVAAEHMAGIAERAVEGYDSAHLSPVGRWEQRQLLSRCPSTRGIWRTIFLVKEHNELEIMSAAHRT